MIFLKVPSYTSVLVSGKAENDGEDLMVRTVSSNVKNVKLIQVRDVYSSRFLIFFPNSTLVQDKAKFGRMCTIIDL